jgi:pyridoxal phosphate enzyme (YggS family)
MIKENVRKILQELPEHVQLVAAAKTRNAAQIEQAIAAGVKIIGENYVQEANAAFGVIGNRVKWHFIGHLQKNKVKKAVKIFDLIETVDSLGLAEEIDKVCAQEDKIMPVLVEINSAKEPQKFGVMPEKAEELIKKISCLKNIKVRGLMTMGPQFGNPEDARPYFSETKRIFDKISALRLPDVEMKYLSMGMTNSYQAAIEEGANVVRIGSKIFGERDED